MRVISQDGTMDVPYEMVVIQRFKEDVYFLNRNLTGVEDLVNDIRLAKYSTEAKAIKAMEMLRETWINETVEFEDGIYHRNIIFQFPKDSEIEVSK
jgi:hypothetical protein